MRDREDRRRISNTSAVLTPCTAVQQQRSRRARRAAAASRGLSARPTFRDSTQHLALLAVSNWRRRCLSTHAHERMPSTHHTCCLTLPARCSRAPPRRLLHRRALEERVPPRARRRSAARPVGEREAASPSTVWLIESGVRSIRVARGVVGPSAVPRPVDAARNSLICSCRARKVSKIDCNEKNFRCAVKARCESARRRSLRRGRVALRRGVAGLEMTWRAAVAAAAAPPS